MGQDTFGKYFLSGLSLANKSMGLLVIKLFLFLPSILSYLFTDSIPKTPLAFLSLGFFFIGIGFDLSLPVFLEQKQQNKIWNYKDIIRVTSVNLKRVVVPLVSIFIILAILILLLLVSFTVLVRPDRESFIQTVTDNWLAIQIIIVALLYLFVFTSFFFSLEKNNLFTSIKKSLFTALKNPTYTIVVAGIGTTIYVLDNYISMHSSYLYLPAIVIGSYVALWLTSSSLFFYQKVVKKSLQRN